MAKTTSARAERARAERLARLPLARVSSRRQARRDDGRGRRRRRHVEPDDLPEGARGRRRVRRAAQGAARAPRTTRRRSSSRSSRRRHEGGLRRCCGRSATRRAGRTATSRWRSTPSSRTTASATFEEAKRLHEWIDEPNLYVKIPATEPGVGAIEDSIARGPQHQRHADLLAAAPRGGHGGVRPRARAARRGRRRPDDGRSVASFFVSRVDTEADKRLDAARPRRTSKGKLAIANAKLAYQNYKRVFSGERWERARREGRDAAALPLGVDVDEEPRYRDVMYVEELIGPDTVNTMPRGDDRGLPGPRRRRATRSSRASTRRGSCSTSCARPASTTTTSSDTLEREGVQKFIDSFAELKQGIAEKRERARPRRDRRAPSSSSGSGRATRPSGPAATRRSGSAGSTSRSACSSSSTSCSSSRTTSSRQARSTTSSCSAWAARRSRPR